MPQPTSTAVIRQDIGDVLHENNLGNGEFVGMEIFPLMNVKVRAAQFRKIAFEEIKTRAVDDRRGRLGNYNQVQHEVTKDTFTTEKRGLEEPVDDDDEQMFGDVFDAELSAAETDQYYLMLNREARIAAIAFSLTVMTGRTTAAIAVWSDAANAKPVKDVELAKNKIVRQLNGRGRGNTRIIGIGNDTARANLRDSDDIKDRAFGGGNVQKQEISEEQLAAQLGLSSVHFSSLQRNGADIWSPARFGVYVVSNNNNLRTTAMFGRTMLWTDSTPTDMMVETYRDEARESDIVRVKHNTVEKLLTARAGHLIIDII